VPHVGLYFRINRTLARAVRVTSADFLNVSHGLGLGSAAATR